MPFDGTLPETDARLALLAERRRVCAELWRGVPREQFDMGNYWCGTAGCALGWLGHLRHDEWHFDFAIPVWMRNSDDTASAGKYFGITYVEAEELFYWQNSSVDISAVTAAMVADRLLALPYTLAE